MAISNAFIVYEINSESCAGLMKKKDKIEEICIVLADRTMI